MPGDATFQQLWKPLQVYAPGVPPLLLKQFVNNAYSRALTAYSWSEMRATGAISLPAPYTTGTITVTNGSPTVTGIGTSWTTADHAQKQLVVNSIGPFWDISTVNSPTNLTLTQNWQGTSGTYTYAIQDIYIVVPSDFQHYTSFYDLGRDWWVLDRSMTQETIDKYDPRRLVGGSSPIQLVPAEPSPFAATLGRPRYELWPRPVGKQEYFFRYDKKAVLLSGDNDTIIFPLRGDIIREGAFEDLSLWPGTEDAPNPYHQGDFIARASYHAKRFTDGVALAEREDREVRSNSVHYREEFKKLFPIGANLTPTTVTFLTGIP